RVDIAVRQNRDGFRRIVKRRIEVGHVIRLRIDRLAKLITHAELETQLAIDFPTVRHERLSLREAEEAHRVERLLAVRAEVAEQRVGESVAGRACIAASVEINLARISGARILIDTIARNAQAGLQRVIAVHPRDRIAAVDVSCRRQQRTRRAEEARETVDGGVWDRVLKASASG